MPALQGAGADEWKCPLTNKRKPVRRLLYRTVLPPLVTWMYKRLGNTWRYETEHEERLLELLKGPRPLVGAFLHGRTFQLLHYFSQPVHGRWMLMCSNTGSNSATAVMAGARS